LGASGTRRASLVARQSGGAPPQSKGIGAGRDEEAGEASWSWRWTGWQSGSALPQSKGAVPEAKVGEQCGCLGSIRKSEVFDLTRVAVNFNCIVCRLEIAGWCLSLGENRTQAGHACATKVSGDLCWVLVQCGEFGSIRKSEVFVLMGVAVNFNCIVCRLEIAGWCLGLEENRTQAGHACATKVSGDLCWVLVQCGEFGSIGKSEVFVLMGVAVNFNCIVCRLEIVRRNTEEGCGKYGGEGRMRIGERPGVGRPAAVVRGPRRMVRPL
jgi:hypothetical protein